MQHLRRVTAELAEASVHEHTPLFMGPVAPFAPAAESAAAPLPPGRAPPLEYWEGLADPVARATLAADPGAAHRYPAVPARAFAALDRALKARRQGAFRQRVGAVVPGPRRAVTELDEYKLPF